MMMKEGKGKEEEEEGEEKTRWKKLQRLDGFGDWGVYLSVINGGWAVGRFLVSTLSTSQSRFASGSLTRDRPGR